MLLLKRFATRLLSLCGVVLVSVALSAARFDLNTPGKIVRVADPQISPDGKWIAVLVSKANFEENRYDTVLTLIDPVAKTSRALTRDRRGISSPRWSPAGDQIAFLAPPMPGAKPQIFVMPMNGGDAWQVTKSPTGVQQFSWGPNGWLAFAAEDERPRKTGEERFNDSFEVGHNDFLQKESPMPVHLWVVNADGSPARRLTSGSWTLPIVLPPSSPASPPVWSPDGKSIAIVKVLDPHTGDSNKASIQVVDVATGSLRPITGRTADESQPVFSPDGTRLAFWSPRDRLGKNVNEINVVSAAGGDPTVLTRAIDRNLVRAIWMPDGKNLLVGGNDHTTTGLWLQPTTAGSAAKKLSVGKATISGSFWVDISVARTGAMAFTASEPQRPAEVFYMPSSEAAPVRITDFNASIAQMELGKTETVEWDAPDGFKADGVLTYPPDFQAGKKYPLVLYVHGGPRAASKEAFSPRAQLMAAKGWVIFEPNYRGSDNLGNAYQSAIWNDAGAGPGKDVMAGVEMLKKRGFIDESKIAVSGWSYGGYMTTWLIGNYPSVWKVAVAGAAVTDMVDQYALGDANIRRGASFGGSPYTDNRMKAYIDQSPITYAPKIKAPTLVLSNTGDYRVTVTQSYKLFRSLQDNGVPTKFVAYPIGGHSPTDPVRQRDVDRRWIGWLGHYLDGSEPAPSVDQ
jgi:dipeptidyl aminopeptidase/acylaminoacyl peptidase